MYQEGFYCQLCEVEFFHIKIICTFPSNQCFIFNLYFYKVISKLISYTIFDYFC
jgi:hypothetical protein